MDSLSPEIMFWLIQTLWYVFLTITPLRAIKPIFSNVQLMMFADAILYKILMYSQILAYSCYVFAFSTYVNSAKLEA